jgi:MEDS: MEthanogen/methylotroph, DcmR Sensory domain
MRVTGVLDQPCGLGAGDHLCWVYEDEGDRDRAGAAFLGEGVDRGERLMWIASEGDARGRRAMAALGDVDALVERRALVIQGLGTAYRPRDPDDQVGAWDEATDAALADGFAGLRVAADVTSQVLDPMARDGFADYEHVVDRYMTEHPFTAMCLYDGRIVGDDIDELACLHPAANRRGVGFSCAAGAGGTVTLAGEVDTVDAGALATALRHATRDGDACLRIDARELTFIDHHGMLSLAAAATEIDLVTHFAAARTLAGILDLDHVTVRSPG